MIGTTLQNRYHLEAELGRGGMGTVYRATDTQTGELVAVKALNPEVIAHAPDLVERFVREGKALRQLNHPNIVRMIAAIEEQGQHYLIVEYVSGGSLEDLLAAQGRLPSSHVIELALDLADALTRAHRLGIIHRDLKPANVLLAQDGTPRLADFGIAHVESDQRLTQTGILMGTIDYLSPEVCQGEPPDERADIWAFGVMLFEMLTGRKPFESKNITAKITAILTQPVPDLAQRAPDIPDALADLVYRMLEKDRQQRIPSMRQVAAELEAILKGWKTPTPAHLAATTPPASSVQSPSFLDEEESIERPIFVTRERELAQLDGFLNMALSGKGRVVFVTGDAGQGKTALVQEFARRAQAAHPDLVVASGNCNAHTGIGDPYLPFREILGLLTGDVEARWAARAISREQARRLWHTLPLTVQALVEDGPDLIDLFVPAAALVKRAAVFTPRPSEADWLPRLVELVERKTLRQAQYTPAFPGGPDLQQSALFEQYTRVRRALACQRPLLLVLDDLHWADGGSINLLFHLGRRIEGSPVLIVGSYRPAEMALGRPASPLLAGGIEGGRERHPLEPVVNEFKRQFGEIEVDLGQAEGQQFVEAFLDTEPNRLGDAFRRTLYQQTRGHPLYTVELLRNMQERRDLVRDQDGQWVEGLVLDWERLPTRVEAVIAERMGRLAEPAREVLQVASVEGEAFTAEVVARVLAADERETVRWLSKLDREHRLVSAQGIRRMGPALSEAKGGQRLSMYHFQHILFQKYLYNGLDPVERAYLHQAVGTALEELYGKGAEEIAVQLARHFQEAGIVEKAVGYLSQAGDRAHGVYAHQETIVYYNRALAMLPEGDVGNRAALLAKLGNVYSQVGDYLLAMQHFEEGLTLAGDAGDPQTEVTALNGLGRTAHLQGRYDEAERYLERGLALAREHHDRGGTALALWNLGYVAWRQGEYEEAERCLEESVVIYRELGDRQGIANALYELGIIPMLRRESEKAKRYQEESLAIFKEIGDRRGVVASLIGLGEIARHLEKKYEEARPYYEESLAISREIGFRSKVATNLVDLGYVHAGLGDADAAWGYLREALGESLAIGLVPVVLHVLVGVAWLRAQAGQYEQSARLLGLSLSHPASNVDTESDAEPALAMLREALPADQLDAALERGKSLNLEQVVAGILEDVAK